MTDDVLIEARGLTKLHHTPGGVVRAVDGIDLSIRRGETLGLVGESGCGKSTLGRTLIRLHEPDQGSIRYGGRDIAHFNRRELRPLRGELQMVFQDPFASLNPRRSIRQILTEPFSIHGIGNRKERRQIVDELIEKVGLHSDFSERYPHEISGGQRQRIAIARAIALDPSVVVCDEPVSALDVSVQAQIINLMRRLQASSGAAYLFISHDLSVIGYMADRIAVMYLGEIVEEAPKAALWKEPLHPYTQALFSAIAQPDPPSVPRRKRVSAEGDIPSAINPPSGCRFRSRCPFAMPICSERKPELKEPAERPGARVSCHLVNSV